ncbi:MAG: 2-amino-4-hydroxy-6-hydroxymethyldihydropteridine diphosphokinase [Lysobacterales bacterium]
MQPTKAQQRIFVGLGGNLGNTRAVFRRALHELTRILKVPPSALSSWYRSEAWGGQTPTPFVNAVVEYGTTLDPHHLLDVLCSVEYTLGRRRAVEKRWADRVVDLDLLAVGSREVRRPGLQVPHPRLADRRFVLLPWAEIAPDFVLPNCQMSVAGLLKICSDKGKVTRVEENL